MAWILQKPLPPRFPAEERIKVGLDLGGCICSEPYGQDPVWIWTSTLKLNIRGSVV